MLNRGVVVVLFALTLAAPVSAEFHRGNVWIGTLSHAPAHGITEPVHDIWVHFGWKYASLTGWLLIDKIVPFASGSGHFLIPAENQVLFHHQQMVSFWDGVVQRASEPGLGYTEIFHDDAELGEIVPMRSGNFLVAERWNDPSLGAKLIEFNLEGRVAEYDFPEVVDSTSGRALGAAYIELLADQCTVLYTLGRDEPHGSRVRRMNICTRQRLSDFGSLFPRQSVGSIRQLRNGNVLVANGFAVFEFTADGSFIRNYDAPGVTHIALSTDGNSFWAAGVHQDEAFLLHFDPQSPAAPATSVVFGNPGMQTFLVPFAVTDLVVVGEWRTGSPLRVRAVRRH